MADKKYVESKEPVAYTSSERVYVDNVVYDPGEVFVTRKPKGDTWEHVDAKQRAAADAAEEDPNRKPDVDLNALEVSDLKALAASLGLNTTGANSKKDLIAVISARDDPTR
jgi:hypothetical protein